MSLFNRFGLAALVTLASLTTVQAADLLTVPVSTQDALPVAEGTAFDWNGFYAGVYGVGQFSPLGGSQYGVGIDVGANAQFDYFLIGGEVAFHGLTGGAGGTTYLQALGKVGVVATDNVLLYAAGGYGVDLGPPAEDDVLLGGGVELAVADNVSLRAQYLHGFPLSGGNPKDQITVGANFHF